SIRTQKLVLCGLLYMKHWKMEKESLWIIFLLNRRRLFMETRSKVLLSVITIYMQQQIAELADALQETYRAVRRIEQGQMDDRIGLLLAGRDQIRYSLNAAPEEKI